jgi:hypothetical protein
VRFILARDVVLAEEDADAFEGLRNRVWANFSPVGPIEEFHVDSMVNAMWRLRRSARAETALFHSRIHGLKADRLEIQVRSYVKTIPDFSPTTVITDEVAHTEASKALQCARHERDRDEVLLGRAIDADAKEGDAFAKLSRYERSLERSLHQAHDELRQIQEKRQNCPSSPISDAIMLDSEDTE